MRPKVMLVALVALTLCNALGRRVTPKSGVGRRSGSKPPARVWDSGDGWDHKAVDVEERERTGGRSRAAKRSAVYDGLRAYDGHWQRLLLAEWRAEQSALREQIERWPPGRLAKEGWLLMDLEVMRLPDDFFGEPVVKLTLPPARRGERGAAATPALSSAGRPPLPFHRFAPGDVVTLCPGDEPKLPAWLEEEEEEEEGGEGGASTRGRPATWRQYQHQRRHRRCCAPAHGHCPAAGSSAAARRPRVWVCSGRQWRWTAAPTHGISILPVSWRIRCAL